jgi:hypothetical protein
VLIGFDLDPSAFMRSGQPSDPVDTRRHGGSYWVAIPGDITDGGIQAPAGGLLIAGAAGDFAALAGKVLTELDKIQTSMGTATVTVPSGGGSAIPIVYGTPYSPSSVASSKLKIPT